jgi:hypothetical protein
MLLHEVYVSEKYHHKTLCGALYFTSKFGCVIYMCEFCTIFYGKKGLSLLFTTQSWTPKTAYSGESLLIVGS